MAKSKRRKNVSSTVKPNRAPRNPLAQHPLMRKGGVHGPSKSSQRSKARREVKKLARDWASSVSKLLHFLGLILAARLKAERGL